MSLPDNLDAMPLGDLVALSAELRDKAAALSQQEKTVRGEKAEVDATIIRVLEAMQIDSTSANGFTVTKVADNIVTVTDWNALHQFINEQQAPYLLQRRVTQDAVKEMIALHGTVPGVELMPQVSLSLRKK